MRSSSRCGNASAPASTAVVLVVPGGYRTEQLGLLLGLAQECGMPVRALVDAAAAASVRPYPKCQLVYVDASLYRVAVSLLAQNGEAQVRAEHALAQGLSGAADTFARRIADHFVRATRFDPFTHAETEQGLYDRLPEWLEALQREERVELSLKYRNEEFRITAERDAILGVTQGVYRAVIQLIAQHREPGKRLVVQLSHRVAALPGFIGELSRLDDSQIERFAAGHAARAVLLAASITAAQGDVKLLKRVPWREAPRDDVSSVERRAPEPRAGHRAHEAADARRLRRSCVSCRCRRSRDRPRSGSAAAHRRARGQQRRVAFALRGDLARRRAQAP